MRCLTPRWSGRVTIADDAVLEPIEGTGRLPDGN